MVYNDEDLIIHGLMPVEDGSDDVSEDGPRWRGVHDRVEYHLIVLSQLMETEKARLMARLLYSYDIYRDTRTENSKVWLAAPPPSRTKIADDHLRGDQAAKAYLAIAPTLGAAPDANGIDRIVARMIDAAAGEGGPIIRDGNTMLGGAAGPRFASDATPTEKLVQVLLYHADRGRKLNKAESQNLWERMDQPVQGTWRSVEWLREHIGGSLPTVYDGLRRLHAKRITEQYQSKSGMRVRLRVPYTFEAANDRAAYCALRDGGFLPLRKNFVFPGESGVPA